MQGEIAKPKKSKVKWPSKDAAYAFTATENQKYGEKKGSKSMLILLFIARFATCSPTLTSKKPRNASISFKSSMSLCFRASPWSTDMMISGDDMIADAGGQSSTHVPVVISSHV